MNFFYLLILNIFSFIVYGLDKLFAKKKMYRMSEKVLLLLSIMGGAIGALASMYFFRHKTKKMKFKVINIISIIIWTYILINY